MKPEEACQTSVSHIYVFVRIFWTWLFKTFNTIPIILNLLTSRNVALIYLVTIWEQKTKDCALWDSLREQGRFSVHLSYSI